MTPLTNSVLNEYIHEDSAENRTDCIIITYEPVECTPILRGSGKIHCNNRTYVFSYNGSLSLENRASDEIAWGEIIPNTGQIIIWWRKHPGQHFLCMSYEFDSDTSEWNAETVPVNWLKEGF